MDPDLLREVPARVDDPADASSTVGLSIGFGGTKQGIGTRLAPGDSGRFAGADDPPEQQRGDLIGIQDRCLFSCDPW
jgi:hypothetical protein